MHSCYAGMCVCMRVRPCMCAVVFGKVSAFAALKLKLDKTTSNTTTMK